MSDYLCALSENSYEILYEIMSLKYRKFIRVYWLLKDYSESIVALKYKEKSEKDKLKLSVSFSNTDIHEIANKLNSCIFSDEIYIDVDENKIDITIHKNELDI